MKFDKLPEGYNSIDITPTNEFLDVIDENGVIGRAYPTFYHEKLIEGKVFHCPKYWDRGWIVELDFSEKMI